MSFSFTARGKRRLIAHVNAQSAAATVLVCQFIEVSASGFSQKEFARLQPHTCSACRLGGQLAGVTCGSRSLCAWGWHSQTVARRSARSCRKGGMPTRELVLSLALSAHITDGRRTPARAANALRPALPPRETVILRRGKTTRAVWSIVAHTRKALCLCRCSVIGSSRSPREAVCDDGDMSGRPRPAGLGTFMLRQRPAH